ncbi:putative dipeptidyl-peptidase IV transcription factor WD40-like family [Helianthus debilis subsp. tardiflorus]
MQTSENKKLKYSDLTCKMPQPDTSLPNSIDDGFPVEKIVQYPLPGYAAPTSVNFSPDDNLISYLFSPDQTLNRKVFVFDLTTCKQQLFFTPPDGGLDEENLSEEDKFRRERSRERGLGVTRYEWVNTSSKKTTVMVPLPAGIYFMDRSLQPQLKLPGDSSPIVDPHLSPDGTMLAYVRNHELNALDLLYNKSKRLTSGANGTTKTHAVAEYIAQEEMERKNGYWWSPDSKYIAFTEVDSSEIPIYRIIHQGKSTVGSEAQEEHAYPFSGATNVKVRLGVVPVIGGSVTWMDLCCGSNSDDEYLVRVNWINGNTLVAQVLNRSHSKLKLIKFDIKTGQGKCILVEEDTTWINLHDCFTPLDRGNSFLWASEKTGFRHLYLHDENGVCMGPITQGDWMVEQIVGVNEASNSIYFTGTLDGPLECHMYRAELFPENEIARPVKLTHGKGKHAVVLDHQMQKFVDVHESLDSPPKVSLCSLHDGSLMMPLFEQQASTIPRVQQLQLEPPKIFQIQAKDGTTLYGALYKPDEEKFGPPPYKTMISVYGGPGVQLVSDSWANTVDMRAQFLRSKGILVWKMDNRGSSRRGLAFEGAVKHNFGRYDAEDQVAGAEWLMKEGLAKAGDIGLYGWSYGGYLSAISLSRFPHVFKCAVSGAPVTSWDGYDSFYTEKYMGMPNENKVGYSYGSVMNHVDRLKGKLLLVHGLIDENVHFRHTARLVNALVGARKPYELLIFPDARHMPRPLKDRLYMEERIWDFIQRTL